MTKDKVLTLLAGGEFISGQEIGAALGVSRGAVWKAVQSLKGQGYEIESVTNRGYRLKKRAEKLTKTEIFSYFGEKIPEIFVFSSVDSTNTVAKRLAEEGAEHGTIVVADCQTAGRGRLGRSFASPEGVGVYLSVILRPQVAPADLLHLTAVAAVAGAEALATCCGKGPGIKWTNDLIFGKKKVAGILTEMSLEAESGSVNYAIVGMGINCNQGEFPVELSEIATSLYLETGVMVNRNQVAGLIGRGILTGFDKMFWEKSAWMEKYRENCVTIGQAVRVVRGSLEGFGTAISVDDDGGLLVEFEDGQREIVNSGEVSVRGMYGYI